MLQRIIYTLIFSFLLSSMMSAWVTFINLGWHDYFLDKWLVAFISSWPAAFTGSLILAKPVGFVADMIFKKLAND